VGEPDWPSHRLFLSPETTYGDPRLSQRSAAPCQATSVRRAFRSLRQLDRVVQCRGLAGSVHRDTHCPSRRSGEAGQPPSPQRVAGQRVRAIPQSPVSWTLRLIERTPHRGYQTYAARLPLNPNPMIATLMAPIAIARFNPSFCCVVEANFSASTNSSMSVR
jgi:hypothetical protein